MNGKRYFLDTNAVIALLQGKQALTTELQQSEWVGISIITQLEFLAFPSLLEEDRRLFKIFCQRVDVIDLYSSHSLLIESIKYCELSHTLQIETSRRDYCGFGITKSCNFNHGRYRF